MDQVQVVYNQPTVVFDGTNLPVFKAAFEAYAVQHQFIDQLQGALPPEREQELALYNRKMAQATVTLTAWLTRRILGTIKMKHDDNAAVMWGRLNVTYQGLDQGRQLRARMALENYTMSQGQSLADWLMK
jgi:hypothetical protein